MTQAQRRENSFSPYKTSFTVKEFPQWRDLQLASWYVRDFEVCEEVVPTALRLEL